MKAGDTLGVRLDVAGFPLSRQGAVEYEFIPQQLLPERCLMKSLPIRTLVITAICLCNTTLAAPATQPVGEVYLGGEVVRPGVYSINSGGTVLDLVRWARGTTKLGDFEIVIYRNTADGKLKQSITVNSLEELKKHPDAAPSLQIEDQVVVKAIKPGAA